MHVPFLTPIICHRTPNNPTRSGEEDSLPGAAMLFPCKLVSWAVQSLQGCGACLVQPKESVCTRQSVVRSLGWSRYRGKSQSEWPPLPPLPCSPQPLEGADFHLHRIPCPRLPSLTQKDNTEGALRDAVSKKRLLPSSGLYQGEKHRTNILG